MKIPIMQALPEAKPFIPVRIGLQRLIIEIDLPPLIPGTYSLDFWIGSHFNSTMDYVKAVVTFEVDESPTRERSAPHSPGHGFLVPVSRCVILPP
jgi:lipopolysaccharide transport system ATP-binding protein